MQIDKVNENRLELAKQSRYVRANEEIIQSQEEKIKQQDTEFANNSDRIFKQGDLIEEQREELKQLSYVLLAMGIPKDQIESSVRISWGHDITIDEIEKSFQNVIEAAKGLVW